MSNINLTINAIERISPEKLRVYGVEKGKEEEHSYEETARAISRKKAGKSAAAGVGTEYGEKMKEASRKYNGNVCGEMIQSRKSLLEDRQQQLAFEKTIQGSRARTIRAAAAYESSFMVY